MTVWDDLVGQPRAVEVLRHAADAAREVVDGSGPGVGMTNAWLVTGPPGSGRSNAATALAAALQCAEGGCGTCRDCRLVAGGMHPDVHVVAPVGLHYLVDDVRDLVRRTVMSPANGRWQVIVLEDADRLEGPDLAWRPANVLLKAVEEPAARTVWVLCAPSLEDVLPTIRSRCRHVSLRTPPVADVADVLVRRDGVDRAMAAFAAQASQSHVGRARRLARDEETRRRRAEVLALPTRLGDVASALMAAADLVDAAKEEAAASHAERDAEETRELATALGRGSSRGLDRQGRAQLKDLERTQKRRATRNQRDVLDLALLDLVALYRDVLVRQLGLAVPAVHADVSPLVDQIARSSTPERSLERIDAILECRSALDANVAPLIAVEVMTLALR